MKKGGVCPGSQHIFTASAFSCPHPISLTRLVRSVLTLFTLEKVVKITAGKGTWKSEGIAVSSRKTLTVEDLPQTKVHLVTEGSLGNRLPEQLAPGQQDSVKTFLVVQATGQWSLWKNIILKEDRKKLAKMKLLARVTLHQRPTRVWFTRVSCCTADKITI